MPRRRSAIINWSQYLALRGIAGLMHCFDIDQNLHTAAAIGSLFHRVSPKRCERAKQHIREAFPDWSEGRVDATARRSIEHMFQIFIVESLIAPRLISPTTWTQYVRFNQIGPLLDLMLRGRPAIFLTGHLGNWELLGCALAAIGYPLVALARPLDNPLINDWLLSLREVRGMRIVTKWGATPILQDTLRHGGRVGFIADQNAGDQGMFVPFFGRLASSYKSIGLLAMRYKVPIVAGAATRIGQRFEYQMWYADIIFPDEWAAQPDPLFYITARYARAIEQMVRRSPEQYLWIHRRWKSRPRHEREGKAMPDRLIQKLRQLPWMTPSELDEIVQRSNIEARQRAAQGGDDRDSAAAEPADAGELASAGEIQ